MVGPLLVAGVLACSLLAAAAVRSPSLVTTLLAAYLAAVGNVGLVTAALSPFREVTRAGLAAAEVVLLAAALAAWLLRGRPGLPLAGARRTAAGAFRDPVVAGALVLVAALLAYELVLGLTVPPNNGDSLSYHLPRVAAWAQHGGLTWIPNAPTIRMNAFQPLAEQQLLFIFVATGSGVLLAVPQLLAELAILLAVYGAARRLGFALRPAVGATAIVATFSVVELEATTAQNDLVAASFPVVAAALLLGTGRLEPALAGVSVAFGLGAKLDTVLVLPVLAWLALARGRRPAGFAVLGFAVGFVAVGMAGFVVNLAGSGHILGAGSGSDENRASPSYPGSVSNAFRLLYGTMDLSVASNRLIYLLAIAGAVGAAGVAAWTFRRAGGRSAATAAAGVATALAAPLLVLGASGLIAFGASRWGFPIRGRDGVTRFVDSDLGETWTRLSNENYSAFGPIGIVALIAASAVTVLRYLRRRADARHLALASALPVFLALLALGTVWSVWLTRFLVVPAVLTAPLLAALLERRASNVAWMAAAGLIGVLTITHDQAKPLESGDGPPWGLTWSQALWTNSRPDYAGALDAYRRLVPSRACVGAVLSANEPSYFLYGKDLRHRVVYLPVDGVADAALRNGVFYVVVSTGPNGWAAGALRKAGWRITPLGTYWQLASEPNARGGECGA